MSTAIEPPRQSTGTQTLSELLEQLGGIAPDRIRMPPPPGTATVADLIALDHHEVGICELVDGVLVSRATGFSEAVLVTFIVSRLWEFVDPPNLGLITGSSGAMEIVPGLVRMPDVAFTSWARIPGGKVPKEPVPRLAPDLAIEILSRSNTPAEMKRKRHEYFEAGVRLLWLIDPRKRIASVFTGPDEFRVLKETDTLDGGDVLPGFTLSLKDVFAELDRLPNVG